MGNNRSSSAELVRQSTVDIWETITDRRGPFEGSHPEATYSYTRSFESGLKIVADVGISILAGTRYEECQDNAIVSVPCDEFLLLAVFDGHGPLGHEVAQRLVVEAKLAFEDNVDHVLELFKTGPEKKIDEFSEHVHKIFDKDKRYVHSGSTATLALVEEGKVHFGWVGDSSAVLFVVSGESITSDILTKPHDLSTKEEVMYVKNHGGRVEQDGPNVKRIFDRYKSDRGPALAMSRAVGDLAAKKHGCRFDFEYRQLPLTSADGEEKFLVVASDGLWNVFEMPEIEKLVLKHRNNANLGEALAAEARKEWLAHVEKIDDISVIALRVQI